MSVDACPYVCMDTFPRVCVNVGDLGAKTFWWPFLYLPSHTYTVITVQY